MAIYLTRNSQHIIVSPQVAGGTGTLLGSNVINHPWLTFSVNLSVINIKILVPPSSTSCFDQYFYLYILKVKRNDLLVLHK